LFAYRSRLIFDSIAPSRLSSVILTFRISLAHVAMGTTRRLRFPISWSPVLQHPRGLH
jgi:hypothetical protein